jgi:hypothetical protein
MKAAGRRPQGCGGEDVGALGTALPGCARCHREHLGEGRCCQLRLNGAVGSSPLLLVGRVNPVELAQQGRPFELAWLITPAVGAIESGGDDLVGDRVERRARLLEGELHRAASRALFTPGAASSRSRIGAPEYRVAVVCGNRRLERSQSLKAFYRPTGRSPARPLSPLRRRNLAESGWLQLGGSAPSRSTNSKSQKRCRLPGCPSAITRLGLSPAS